MKTKTVLALAFLVLSVAVMSSTAWANDPATLFINGGAGDPNLIKVPPSTSFNVIQNSGGAGTIANIVLLFSVPNVTSAGNGGITGLTSSVGTVGSLSLAGILATSTTCNNASSGLDVYSCAGISGTDQSNSLTNLAGADLTINGITATRFGIYTVTITGANLAGGGSITIGFGSIPKGTFVDAYGCNTDKCFATPFTEAGLTTVPEPTTLALFGTGVLALAGVLRRRLF